MVSTIATKGMNTFSPNSPNWREDPQHYEQQLCNIRRAMREFKRAAHACIYDERRIDRAIDNLALYAVSSPAGRIED